MPAKGWVSRPELSKPDAAPVKPPRRVVVDSPFRVQREPVPTLVIDYQGETRTYVMDRSGTTHRIDTLCGHWTAGGDTCRLGCED